MELLEWYNLIFVAPVGLAAIYLGLSASGIGDLTGEGDIDHDVDADFDHDLDLDMDHDVDVDLDHDVDLDMDHDVDVDLDHDVDLDMDHDLDLGHDVDMDHDLDVGHDVDMDHDVDVGHDIDHGVDADHDVQVDHGAEADHGVEAAHHEMGSGHVSAHHEPSLMLKALAVLGLGKVPLSILMTCLMVIFGSTGLIANGLFGEVLTPSWAPTLYFWPSLGLALLASFGLTGKVARGLNRIMPTKETYALTEEDLVGRVGVCVYGIRAGTRGPVSVQDESGTVLQVMGRALDGDLSKGTDVILVRYHREGDYYDAAASPLSTGADAAGGPLRAESSAGAEDVAARRDSQRASTTQS